MLRRIQAEHLETLRTEGAEERQIQRAENDLRRLERAGAPLALLGEPAPAWTLEHAFGDTETLADLRGKVVVVDFWATWCPWCIRSFPALRDLLRDYRERGLEVIGVTASANSVYASRYDLDDDLADRAEEGARARPVAVLERGRPAPEGTVALPEAEYRAREIEVITEFIANHEMDWPVVMIDKEEPAAKYALGGWPHALVIDREGRVRYVKSGALLRDRAAQVAAFRQVLEDLLAEGGPE
ncbi:MAG: peroxiredoxin family protein [Planctomycetota bacterium]